MRRLLLVGLLCLAGCAQRERDFSDPDTGARYEVSIKRGSEISRYHYTDKIEPAPGGGIQYATLDGKRWTVGSGYVVLDRHPDAAD